jgi:ribosomal protein S18 acetylase RimI-like enzyme
MEIELVREAVVDEHPVGLVMVRTFYDAIGYVYYIVVAKDYRRRKIATRLLEHSLEYFSSLGMHEVYASVEEGNVESEGLFRSRGFARTSYREVSGKYGNLRAINLYRKMLVVPGEILLCRPLDFT